MPLHDYRRKWDDLRFPATGVQLGGQAAPPGVQASTGLFLFDGVDTAESIAILAQLPHAWRQGSNIKPHLHWSKTSDVAGTVYWSLRYKWFNVGEIPPAFSAPVAATLAVDPEDTQAHAISTFGEIDATGKLISSLFLCQIARDPTNEADTYEADVLLYEFDIHYQVDSMGSEAEFVK